MPVTATFRPAQVAVGRRKAVAALNPGQVQRGIISLEDILGYIVRRWRLALVLAGLASGGLFLLLIGRSPVYHSEASLLFRIQDNKVFTFDKFVDNSAHENSIPYILNNHKIGLESQRFREFLWQSLPDSQRHRFMNAGSGDNKAAALLGSLRSTVRDIRGLIGGGESGDADAEDGEVAAFLRRLERSIHVDVVKETHILKVRAGSPDRILAGELANLYCESYVRFLAAQDLDATRSASEFLQQQAGELKLKVEESERQLFVYRQQQGLMEDDEREDITAERVKTMSQQLTETQLQLAETEHYLEQIEALQREGRSALEIGVIASDPVIAKLRDDEAIKAKERATIASRYGKRHPTRIETEQAYLAVAASLQEAVDRMVAEMHNRARLYQRQAGDLEARLQAAETDVFDVGAKNIELTMLRKKLEADRALYESIALRLNEASVSSRFDEVGNLRILDYAVPAARPSSPNLPLSAVIAAMVFSCVFTCVPVGLGLAQDVASSPWFHRMRRVAASEPLARVPRFGDAPERQVLRAAAGGSGRVPDPELLRLVDEIESVSPRMRRTLLVTSGSAGEGKSLVAAALASVYASQGLRTLIVDCNLRRPSLHRWFESREQAPSLGDWLRSEGGIRLAEDALRCGTLPIFALQAGGKTDDPAPFLSRNTFNDLVNHAAEAFDCVIIDAPQIDGAPEVLNLVGQVTDVLLVWNRKVTTKGRLVKLMDRLERVRRGTCLLGAVENEAA